MNNCTATETCEIIESLLNMVNVSYWQPVLNVFVSDFKNPAISYNEKCTLIEQIVHAFTFMPCLYQKLVEPKLITHEILFILRDHGIIDQLHQIQIGKPFQEQILLETSTLFMNLSYFVHKYNVSDTKNIFLCKTLADEIAVCLQQIARHGQHMNNKIVIRSINSLLVAFKNLLKRRIIRDDHSIEAPVYVGITECLCSSHAVNLIKNFKYDFTQNFDENQILLLGTMPWYMNWYSGEKIHDQLLRILRNLLPEFIRWLSNCSPVFYRKSSYPVGNMTLRLSTLLVRPVRLDRIREFSEEFYREYSDLAVYWSSAFASVVAPPCDVININWRTQVIIQILYNLTIHTNVLNFMKTIPNLVSLFLKMADCSHEETQLNVYRCLSKLMVEEDIKLMENPGKITAVHIKFIKDTINDTTMLDRFNSLWDSLKSFVQHEQVKIDLIKQDALSLLIKCIVEPQFDQIKVQQPALEILIALSFHIEARSILKRHKGFMNLIRNLCENKIPTRHNLQRAAEALLWKLEQEDKAVAKQAAVNSYQYDIMISYSHRDEKLCFQIYDQLKNDGFKVWLDRDCLRGSTMIGMADAIENSEYVLLCMSNTYKESVYCQSEAHYAFERRCRLIPVIVEPQYKPDGWLGIIVSGKIFVNFAEIEFSTAYEKLKLEIIEQKRTSPNDLSLQKKAIMPAHVTCLIEESTEEITGSFEDLPKSIADWSVHDVKLFLRKVGLSKTILLLCQHIDGPRLLTLYEMCDANRESMYQSLKCELNELYKTLLPITDYLNLLHEIKPYIPQSASNIKSGETLFSTLT